jgi:hypothetical protein
MRVRNKILASLGQRYRVIYPLEKQASELVLELLYLKGNRRLRVAELLCRPSEASLLRDMYKGDQIS